MGNLSDFIKKHGDPFASKLLDVEPRTIKSYRLMEKAPRPLRAASIISKSGGQVTWEGIYKPYVLNKLKKLRGTK